MNLRCRQGDLAVIVRPLNPVNLGKFVTVIKPIGMLQRQEIYKQDGVIYIAGVEGFHWWIEGQTPFESRGRLLTHSMICDSQLRPIRDPGDDGVDETLLLQQSNEETIE